MITLSTPSTTLPRHTPGTAVWRAIATAIVTVLCIFPLAVDADAAPVGSSAARTPAVRGTLVALPFVAQPGSAPAAPANATTLVATFDPAAPGQSVTFERRTRRGWRVVAREVQDTWGSATTSVRNGSYRAITTRAGRTWVTGQIGARAWRTQFEDTFSGAALDATVWNSQRREHETEYAPRSCARTDAAASRVEAGVLHLGVQLDPERVGQACPYTWNAASGSSPYYLNSQVATEFTRFTRHGIIAARMKVQRADGMHTGFWMLPQGTQFVDGDPSRGTEIDVMEFWGANGSGRETVGSHVGYYEPGWTAVRYGGKFTDARKALQPGHSWWDSFHVFSVEWTPREYVFRVDGREYYRETRAVSQAQQYLVLSMLTSDYELANLDQSDLADTSQVDWVRVYDATSNASARISRGRPSSTVG